MFLSCPLGHKGTWAPAPSCGLNIVENAVTSITLAATVNCLWRAGVGIEY